MVRDAFPLPRIDEALQAVHNCQWFTSFDLAQGYLQMPVEEADIPKTAFRAGSSGLYEFTRMPFGLSNSGSSFCRLMEMCLGDQQFVTLLLYLDDICIFAASIDEMLDRIELVFKQLEDFNLKIKPKKCHFFQRSVIFLGHILSAEGISANPEKVEKVKNWPVPTNPKELQSFLGLASYYRRFIPKFAAIAKCLHQLVGPANHQKSKKNKTNIAPVAESQSNSQTFLWTGEHQEAFDLLKACLTSAPVLGYPDFNRPFELETDASLQGLGAVLSQRDETGTSRVIAFASRSLRPSEQSMRNYSSAKLELLALKWAVTEKFRDYLLGSRFTVYTDNNPLAYVKESKLGAAQIRWLSELALFDFDIKYRSGKLNQAADALSRRPVTDEILSNTESDGYETISYAVMCDDLSEVIEGEKLPLDLKRAVQVGIGQQAPGSSKINAHSGMVDVLSRVTPGMMKEAQEEDVDISKTIRYVKSGKKPMLAQIRKIKSRPVRRYLRQFDRLVFRQGVLHRVYEQDGAKYHQLILPLEFRAQAMELLHGQQGHQAVERTLQLVRERFYWSTLLQDVTKWVKNCKRCQTAKGPYVDPDPPQGSIVANNPMDLLCIDFMKVDPSKDGKENVLVMTDAFSKFSVAVVTPNQQAKTVAKALVDKWFYVYGIPTRIHSDQGKSFDNKIIEQLCKIYGVKQSTTTPYNPRGNSPCERLNCTLQNLLKTLPKDQKPNWPAHLSALVFAYNAMPHSTTGYQPYQLMFGCKAQTPCDNWLGLSQYDCSESVSKDSWVQQQFELVRAANQRALRSIRQSTQKSAGRLNQKSLEIPEGNLVLLRDHPEGRNKIQDKYKSEKFVVVGKRPEPNVYHIKPVNGNGPKRTVNRRQLQDLGKTQNDGGLTSPQNIHDGVQVPSFNPKTMTSKTPPISHGYATRSKGRPPVHSLSTTAGVGSSGLRPAQPQRVTFCSRCTGNSFWV